MSSKRQDKLKSRQSAPAAMVGNPPPMWPMWGNPYQMNPMMGMGMMNAGPAPGPSFTTNKKDKKPWDESSSDSEEDEDFVPSKKRKPSSTNTNATVGSFQAEKKSKRGRPKKELTVAKEARQAEDSKLIAGYPNVTGKDEIAYVAKEECKSCRLWKGRLALQPCGHSLYCYSCMTKFKAEATELNRPGKCPAEKCYSLVTSWFKLFNVSP